jgi:hypothetical protein
MMNKKELGLVIERARAYPAGHGYAWGSDGEKYAAPAAHIHKITAGQASWQNA